MLAMVRHPLAALAACLAASAAWAAPEPIGAEVARPYLAPQQMVEVEPSRRLNLVCTGQGKHTVLFEAGGSDWSVTWALVQPAVARHARACTYDRAGLGYSDPAPGPRSPIAIAEDLRRLIKTSGLKTPLVLVGHSLGGFNAKLYAALYPEDVAGLVLIDPAEERSWERSRPMVRQRFGEPLATRAELLDRYWLGRLMERYRGCEVAARPNGLEAESVSYKRCSDPARPVLGPMIAAERKRLQVTATYQSAQASEILNSIYGEQGDDHVYAELFKPGMLGDRPVTILTHGNFDANDPLEALSQLQGVALHQQTAALSRRGAQQTVPDTNHNIQLEKPEVIVAAIDAVLGRLK